MDKENFITPDQVNDAEKWCQLLQRVPDEKRQLFSVSALSYMNGLEAGIAMERNTLLAGR